jgi:nitrate/nitrite-specific signal transduction histidine kinase
MPTELELLQKIAENTSGGQPLFVALVAGGSAIAGSLLTGILSYIGIRHTIASQNEIERAKLQASIVTAERLRWLQDLRNKVAAFYANIEMQLSHLKRPVTETKAAEFQELLDRFSESVMKDCYSIFPMLDREKDHQRELHDALNETLTFAKKTFAKKTFAPLQFDVEEIKLIKSKAFDALEAIGRKAWTKVQKLQ